MLDGPTAVPTVNNTKTVNVPRDFCLSAGREDRSSRPVSGAISRSPSVRGIIPPRSPSTRTTRTVAGGDSNLRTNWRAITATSQLRSRRLQNQYQSGKKPNAPGSSGKTTQTGRANGPGIALRSHDTHKNACARFEKQSTWAPHPEEREGLLQPSWLTKLPSQKRSLPEERPSVLPGSNESKDVQPRCEQVYRT